MSRNRIEANRRLFNRLDKFCNVKNVKLDTYGKPRWLATKSPDKYILDHMGIADVTAIGGGRYLAIGSIDDLVFMVSAGFKFSEPPDGFTEIDPGPGHLTAILSEVPVGIVASPYEVKDAIDLHDRTTPGYKGHDFEKIHDLFHRVRVFSSLQIGEDPWGSFFKFCIEERAIGIPNPEDHLLDALRSLADLDPNLLPYRVMCRSIFDVDPSSFFLSLYRCLESLYSFSSAQELGRRLQIKQSWQEIAGIVENVTGWYPRDESSLEALLRRASSADLRKVVSALGGKIEDGQSPSVKAAKEIYALRNAVVHYRPAHQMRDLNDLNWPSICVPLVGLILDVYVEAGHTT